ncbi:MAG TPA: isoprenylcysteine carboxylmethyltransferase family protein, partial [Mycobacterium sp.]|nr:isoprenylcysteine carboxylmethyltransferase family protein [Mycobacterium sp.]
MKAILKRLVLGLTELAVFGLMLFLSAGTINYWQAWIFLVVFAVSTWITGLYVLRTNPVALQQRMRAGPTAESRLVQKVVIVGW